MSDSFFKTFKQTSDPKILVVYRGRVILLTFTYCANRFCSLNSLSLKTDAELPILVVLQAALWQFKQCTMHGVESIEFSIF